MQRIAPVILLLLAGAAEAAGDHRPMDAITVDPATASPIIDGSLDDPTWRNVDPIGDFHQQGPRYRAAPTEETRVRFTYDRDHFYIAAKLYDRHPGLIRATQLVQGSDISADDRFWCSLDTFNSKRNDYFFEVNANGVRGEALRENNSRFIAEWTTIWHAASRIDSAGWTTELAIPFKSISFDPAGGAWRVNCGRWIMRKQEHVLLESTNRLWWAADSRELLGISGVRQGLGLDISASTTVGHRRDSAADVEQTRVRPSADLYWRMTPSMTAALTLNSDFSTADVDDLQVALDRFSLFFPEKRDFFLQDAGIFEFGDLDTNGRPFFSRRIGLASDGTPVTIDAGGKLTGRAGPFSIGALAVRQENVAGTGTESLAVARGVVNVLEESALGFIFTHGDPTTDLSNTLYGADFFYRTRTGPFGGTLQGYLWLQSTRTPGLGHGDSAMGAALEFPNDRVNWRLAAQELQENFNPALGFVNRRGIRQYDGAFRYRTRPEQSPLREIDHELELKLVNGTDGQRQSLLLRVRPVRLANNANDSVYFEWQRNREVITQAFTLFRRLEVPSADYTFDHYRLGLQTGVQRPIVLAASLQDGRFFGGERLEKAAEIGWRPSMHFYLQLGYTENDVALPSGTFTSRLASLRGDVAMNAYWSFGVLLQYDNAADLLGGSTRLRYQPRDGQEVLLVVNSASEVATGSLLTRRQDEALLKLSYTFRF